MRNEWRRWMDDSLSLLESGFSQWRTRKEPIFLFFIQSGKVQKERAWVLEKKVGWHQLFLSLVCVAWSARVGDSVLRNRERDGRRSIVPGNWWRWNNDQEWINHQQILLRRPHNWGRSWCCHLGQDAKSLRSQLRKWRSLQGVERNPKIMMKFRDKPYSYELISWYASGSKKLPPVKLMSWEGKLQRQRSSEGSMRAPQQLTKGVTIFAASLNSWLSPNQLQDRQMTIQVMDLGVHQRTDQQLLMR